MTHSDIHPLHHQVVKVQRPMDSEPIDFEVEDWWDHLTGKSWMDSNGNFAAMNYAMRAGLSTPPLPLDDEVIYGKIGGLGHLIHISEFVGQTPESDADEGEDGQVTYPAEDWEVSPSAFAHRGPEGEVLI